MTEIPSTSLKDLLSNRAKLLAGVSESALQRAESDLELALPTELKGLLRFSNGIDSIDGPSLLWSVSEMVEKNQFYRLDTEIRQKYMPLNDFLFFADAPSNGLFGYPITRDNEWTPWIFHWNGITDARKSLAASSLEQLYTWLLVESESAKILMRHLTDISGWKMPQPDFEKIKTKMLAKDCKTFEPATTDMIEAVEKTLGMVLPEQLKQFYLFSNGMKSQFLFKIFPVDKLLEENATIKAEQLDSEWVMPAESFLFCGPEGNGDYYGFPITGAGIGNSIMELDHEDDSRDYFAKDLFGLLYCELEMEDDDDD